eukprot:jgi/Mesvir1/29496/Mv19746-RA.1
MASLRVALWSACLLSCLVYAAAMYQGSDVISLNPSTFTKMVIKSPHIWFIEFYAPWCGHCQRLKPDYIKAAAATKNVVRFGAVDCDEHKGLCGEYGVRGFPTLKIFGVDKRKPQDYQGARDAKAMAEAGLAQLPSSGVKQVAAAKLTQFLSTEPGLPKALLFSSKTSTPNLYKALSLTFKGRMVLGEVRKKEQALVDKYEVADFPTLLVLSDDGEVVAKFDGSISYESVVAFLEQYAKPGEKDADDKKKANAGSDKKDDKKDKGSKQDKEKEKEKEKEKNKEKEKEQKDKDKEKGKKRDEDSDGRREASKPNKHKGKVGGSTGGDVVPLSQASLAEHCVGKPGYCVVGLIEGGEAEAAQGPWMEKLKGAAKKYHEDPLHFLWSPTAAVKDFAAAFGLGKGHTGSVVLVINTKKAKYARVEDLDLMEAMLDRALGGDLHMEKLAMGELPQVDQ